jgi:hypothetical protein
MEQFNELTPYEMRAMSLEEKVTYFNSLYNHQNELLRLENQVIEQKKQLVNDLCNRFSRSMNAGSVLWEDMSKDEIDVNLSDFMMSALKAEIQSLM